MPRLTLSDLDFAGRRVFVRVDFNVPLDGKRITDDSRIRAALPTILHILQEDGRLILASHLGRPQGKGFEPDFSMEPVRERLTQLLNRPVQLCPEIVGQDAEKRSEMLQPGDVMLLENLRFEAGEKRDDPKFAAALRRLADLYVNDAFGTCHRADASIHALPGLCERPAAGLLVEKEIHYFDEVLGNPDRPYVAIMGGAKVSDKIPAMEHLIGRVNTILVGGAMAYTFLKAAGEAVGVSRVEEDRVKLAGDLLKRAASIGTEVVLPVDHVAADHLEQPKEIMITEGAGIPEGLMGLDIGPETIVLFSEKLSTARTTVWNGPMGVFEKEQFAVGTLAVAEAMAENTGVTVVGGGDSAAAIDLAGVRDRVDHVSTGGGASLAYLAGEEMPGIAVLGTTEGRSG